LILLSFVVRKVDSKLLPDVYRLERACFSRPYTWFYIKTLFRRSPETFLVAVSGSSVLGYAVAEVKGVLGHLISIAVDDRHRKRGVGEALFAELSKALSSLHVRKIVLEVRKSNLEAQQFYGKLGFKQHGLIIRYYENGEDALVFSKQLLFFGKADRFKEPA